MSMITDLSNRFNLNEILIQFVFKLEIEAKHGYYRKPRRPINLVSLKER